MSNFNPAVGGCGEEVFIGDVGVGDEKDENEISGGGCEEAFDGCKEDRGE